MLNDTEKVKQRPMNRNGDELAAQLYGGDVMRPRRRDRYGELIEPERPTANSDEVEAPDICAQTSPAAATPRERQEMLAKWQAAAPVSPDDRSAVAEAYFAGYELAKRFPRHIAWICRGMFDAQGPETTQEESLT